MLRWAKTTPRRAALPLTTNTTISAAPPIAALHSLHRRAVPGVPTVTGTGEDAVGADLGFSKGRWLSNWGTSHPPPPPQSVASPGRGVGFYPSKFPIKGGKASATAAAAAAGTQTTNLSPRRQGHNICGAAPAGNNFKRTLSTTTPTNATSLVFPPDPRMYTASFAFFEALWDAGVTHCFVNLGSDHPSIIEAMVKGTREKKGQFPRIITCPNEMVAMSMADGYARLTNKPQCVIVHVDVGTQGLGAAVHNASSGRAPVLVFAGLSPFTQEGEMRGSRTEYIHWIQDVPDQKAIVAQYCRYAAELKTGANVKQMVNRALQFASSAPQGPVYLCGAREVMEEEIKPYSLRQEMWKPVELGGLPKSAVKDIAEALAGAEQPLLITGYAGRNHAIPAALVELANTVKGLRVLDTGGSEMCFPADHPAWLGLRFGNEESIRTADAILVLDCDVPWIMTQCKPRDDAKVYHIDVDPLKQMMPLFYIHSLARYRADALTSIEQLTALLRSDEGLKAKVTGEASEKRWSALEAEHKKRLETIASKAQPLEDGGFGTGHLCTKLKELCPKDTIWAIEAVTNTGFVHDNLQPTLEGSWINCGGGGLGWSGGGALGIKLASDYEAKLKGEKGKFVVQVVGDGTFLFSVPGSVYWIAKRYNIPVLTIVLNNKGWNAPRKSLLLVHPDGLGSTATNEEINISFDPVPDYSGIAKAAAGGDLFAARVDKAADLEGVLKKAIEAVQGGQTAVLDCKVALGC
ncbi:thiamine pyrophosphate enzyme, N-terminal TPP binding domain-containing protein [Diplogelasinospora grovesii]|uniref:Thiamine pyrophosphate enzyme, N-terminal TPP binding domain-containing protein n=1 Tax=Diplogelasinospora grovesii TaxID=303347 RepID=A0AAN6S059_9PEZI|nr:thiamine pyrophosphate enzyme, N-terminal TPP binding domain-containing protein [Diplogelasinospora grovesii]